MLMFPSMKSCASVLVAVSLAAAPTLAHAQIAEPSAPAPAELSEDRAVYLSLGATALGAVALAGNYATGGEHDGTFTALALTSFVVGPSVGHFYAGDRWTTGLTIRLAGATVVAIGAAMDGTTCHHDDVSWGATDSSSGTTRVCSEDARMPLLLTGGAVLALGAIIDVASTPSAVRIRNARERARFQDIALAPRVTDRDVGLTLSGRF
jgi:hypothetical protein